MTTGRRIEQPDRVVSSLGSPSLADLDAQVISANARRVLLDHCKRVALRERNRAVQLEVRARRWERVRRWFGFSRASRVRDGGTPRG